MPADTYSSILGWLQMGTGNDNNTWGTNWNNSVGLILEKAIAGRVSHAVTGGTLDLSGTPPPAGPSGAIEAIHNFTGVLTSTQTVIFPNLSRVYFVRNSTSGSFGLLAKAAGGTAVNCPAGKTTILYCDGATNCVRDDAWSVGVYVQHAISGVNLPGTLHCDGSSYLAADYPDLFAAIGYNYGGGGANFSVPNLTDTGRYLRQTSGSGSTGTPLSNQNKTHTHGFSFSFSNGAGSTDSQGNHIHNVYIRDPQHTHGSSGGISGVNPLGSGGSAPTCSQSVAVTINNASTGVRTNDGVGGSGTDDRTTTNGAHTHSVTGLTGSGSGTTNADGGSEARPETMVCRIGIRY